MSEIEKLKTELERVNAACAEMRDALLMAKRKIYCGTSGENVTTPDCECEACGIHHAIAKAIAADAGKGYVAADRIKPLVEALKKHHDHASESCNVFFEQDGKPIDIYTDLGEDYQESSLCEQTCLALAAARELGI